jgi:bis(5'-nucleosyl)-tetraphosphatase (symmetrical)
MATYVVADIQGCYDSFIALLTKLSFSKNDQLIVLGDLVNRGPKSAEVLRWMINHQNQVKLVLGNHDLHLIAYAEGAELHHKDTIQDFFLKPDAMELIGFLRKQPLFYEAHDAFFVHAGLHPCWDLVEIRERNQEAQTVIQSAQGPKLLAALKKLDVSEHRWVESIAYFTRVRMLHPNHHYYEKYKGPINDIKHLELDIEPWFVQRARQQSHSPKVFFGHWAALGSEPSHPPYSYLDTYFCLDTGCVWGKSLMAMRLDDFRVFEQKTVEPIQTPASHF